MEAGWGAKKTKSSDKAPLLAIIRSLVLEPPTVSLHASNFLAVVIRDGVAH